MQTTGRHSASIEITKILHTEKTTYKKHKQNEQINLNGILSVLKSKTQQTQCQQEQIPNIKAGNGSDSIFYYFSTYSNIMHLYGIASQKKMLQDQDKDYNLPNKFLNNSNIWFSSSYLSYDYSSCFFINRVICNIYSIIAAKQKLTDPVIKKLFLCIQPIEKIKKIIFDTVDDETLAYRMIGKDLALKKYNNSPSIVASVAKRIYTECLSDVNSYLGTCSHDKTKLISIINPELEQMRCDAMQAIYYCVIRNRSTFMRPGSNLVAQITQCLQDNNKTLKKLALKILNVIGDAVEVNHAVIFATHLKQLDSPSMTEQEIEDSLFYLLQKIYDSKLATQLFTPDILLKIMNYIHTPHFNLEHKIICLDLARHYVISIQALSTTQIEQLIVYLENNNHDGLFNEIFKVILLNTETTKTLPADFLPRLMPLTSKLSYNNFNLIIMTLFMLDNKRSIDFNLFMHKLTDHNIIVQNGDDFQFEPKNTSNQPTIAAITAKIIVDSISSGCLFNVTNNTLQSLINAAVSSKETQVRIYAAQALYLAYEQKLIKNNVSRDMLLALQPLCTDPIFDICVYISYFYVMNLYTWSCSHTFLPMGYFTCLTKIYIDEELVLNNVNFSLKIRPIILNLISQEVYKNQILPDDIFKIFEFITHSDFDETQHRSQERWLYILIQYVEEHHHKIPHTTIEILENYLINNDFTSEHACKILIGIINNGQQVTLKSLNEFKNILLNSKNKQQRHAVINCLEKIQVTLPNVLLELLEQEKFISCNSIEDILAKLEQATASSQPLTQTAWDLLLLTDTHVSRVLSILQNLINNNHDLNFDIMHWLEIKFNIQENFVEMTTILCHLEKSNYQIPDSFLKKLIICLQHEHLKEHILPIFLIKGQRGDILSARLIDQIFMFRHQLRFKSLEFKQNYLSAMCGIIQSVTISQQHLKLAEEIFKEYTKDKNKQIIKIAIFGLTSLQNSGEILEPSSVNVLEDFDAPRVINPESELSQTQHLTQIISYFNFAYEKHLPTSLSTLLQNGWSFTQLSDLLISANLSEHTNIKEKILHNIFYLMAQYNLSVLQNYPLIKDILLTKPHSTWLGEVNQCMIAEKFLIAAPFKNPTQLIQDLMRDNDALKAEHHLLTSLKTIRTYKTILDTWNHADLSSWASNNWYSLENLNHLTNDANMDKRKIYLKIENSHIYYRLITLDGIKNGIISEREFGKSIPDTIDDINLKDLLAVTERCNHTFCVKDEYTNFDNLLKLIAIINQALTLITRYQLTDTQILACLVALKTTSNANSHGRFLLQVQTGEGKTIIISILAIIHALQGKKVDILTSSPVEAERCAREQSPLYKLFQLTVADNLDRAVYIKGAKKCYQCNVVYGEISQFQFDTLRDEYGLLGTRAKRGYDVMLGDEIDSILIDDSTKIAKLTSPVAGMDQFHAVYIDLATYTNTIMQHLYKINGTIYFFEGVVSYENTSIVLTLKDRKIENLELYLINNPDPRNINGRIVDSIELFIAPLLHKYLDKLIETKTILIPKHLNDFVARQKSRWINNAIAACINFHENMHYLVLDNLIKPVAFTSNGTVQNSMHWSDGLHQCLQIKHELAISSETFTTNFLSNMAYVKRYTQDFYGFTGTLGQKVIRDKLEQIYEVKCFDIPSSREKQYKNLDTLLTNDIAEWQEEIYLEVQYEIEKNRGVLIICKTIEDVLSLEKYIKSRNKASIIKTYTMDGMNQEKEITHIVAREIIIATSLGGRGMDIKADAINKAGGLHVILTFMADHRNTAQALYRTSRIGKLGSGRKILNKHDLLQEGYNVSSIHELEAESTRHESRKLEYLFGEELALIAAKDRLFSKFCELVGKIRSEIRKKSRGIRQDCADFIQSYLITQPLTVLENVTIASIEERWAMLLRNIDDKTIAIRAIDAKYAEFSSKIQADYASNQLIQNPFHHIAIANDLVMSSFWSDNNLAQAEIHYNKAIQLDEQFSAAAYAGKAWLYIKNRHSHTNYKQLAIEAFEKALALAQTESIYLTAQQTQLINNNINQDSLLMKQLLRKSNMLGSFLNSIKSNIEHIKKSQRLMTLQMSHQVDFYRYYTTINEVERAADGTIEEQLLNGTKFNLQLNSLTVRRDLNDIDQALKTLNALNSLRGSWKDEARGYCIKVEKFATDIWQNFTDYKCDLELLNVTHTDYATQLGQIIFTSMDLTCSGSKTSLINLLKNNSCIFEVTISHIENEKQIFATYLKKEAIVKLQQSQNDNCTFTLRNLNQDVILSIWKQAVEITTDLQCYEVQLTDNIGALLPNTINISFFQLNKDSATRLITILREKNIDFSLCVENLNADNLKKVIKAADLTQEDVVLADVKSLASFFADEEHNSIELAEFASRGIEYILLANERNFIPWRSIITITAMASVQIAVGAVLIPTGFGATVGMGLITEGFSDLITACRILHSRQISMQDFLTQKAVSIVISASCIGLQALQDAGKGASLLTTGLQEEALEQLGVQLVTNSRNIELTLKSGTQQLQNLTYQYVGSTAARSASREVLNMVSDTFVNFCFKQYHPQIADAIGSQVVSRFSDSELKKIICKLLFCDKLQNNSVRQSFIEYSIGQIIHPTNSFWMTQMKTIGYPLSKGILSQPQLVTTPVSMAARIVFILNGLKDVACVIDNLHDELLKKCLTIEQDPLFLQQTATFNAAEAAKIDLSPITHNITTILTQYIILAAEQQLIAPVTSFIVANTLNTVSDSIENALIRRQLKLENQEDDSKLSIMFDKDGPWSDELRNNITSRNKLLQKKDQYTYANRIATVGAEHALNISLYSSALFAARTANTSTTTIPASREIEDVAQQMREDLPANLAAMCKLATTNKLKIKFSPNDDYELTNEDLTSDYHVIVFIKGETKDDVEQPGHWRLKDKATGSFVEIQNAENDCGYAIMAHLTGKSIAELRNETADAVLQDHENFARSLNEQNWIKSRYKKEAASLNMVGGAKTEKSPKILFSLGNDNTLNERATFAFASTNAAYLEEEKIIAYMEKQTGRKVEIIKADPTSGSYRCIILRSPELNFTVIAGRGSDKLDNFIYDDRFLFMDYNYNEWPVVQYTAEFIQNAKRDNLISNSDRLAISGHSLFAPVATIFASREENCEAFAVDSPGLCTNNHNLLLQERFYQAEKHYTLQGEPNIVNKLGYIKQSTVSGNVWQLKLSQEDKLKMLRKQGFTDVGYGLVFRFDLNGGQLMDVGTAFFQYHLRLTGQLHSVEGILAKIDDKTSSVELVKNVMPEVKTTPIEFNNTTPGLAHDVNDHNLDAQNKASIKLYNGTLFASMETQNNNLSVQISLFDLARFCYDQFKWLKLTQGQKKIHKLCDKINKCDDRKAMILEINSNIDLTDTQKTILKKLVFASGNSQRNDLAYIIKAFFATRKGGKPFCIEGKIWNENTLKNYMLGIQVDGDDKAASIINHIVQSSSLPLEYWNQYTILNNNVKVVVGFVDVLGTGNDRLINNYLLQYGVMYPELYNIQQNHINRVKLEARC